MSANQRLERYSKIRSLLDFPNEQSPNPHQILSQMLTSEQTLNLRLTNTHQAWNLMTSEFESVAGQSIYDLPPSGANHATPGKVYFVIRSDANNATPYLPVEYDEFSALYFDQQDLSERIGTLAPERISFYRTAAQNQALKAILRPTPTGVFTYQITSYTGSLDRLYATMDGTAQVAELSDYLDLSSALVLLPYTKWSNDAAMNSDRRREIAAALNYQLERLESIVEEYIENLNQPAAARMGYWNDED